MKRPLCTACILFLIIQAARTVLIIHPDRTEQSEAESVLADGSKQIILTGTADRIEEKEKVTAVFLKNNQISIADQKISESKVMVYVKPDQNANKIRAGNRLRVTGEAAAFDTARNPGNFDQKFYYRKQKVYFYVWAENVEIVSGKTDPLKDFLQGLRAGWKEILTGRLGEYYGNTMSAVLLGEKSGLDEEMKKLYQKNGIGHILAISGLHMSFIGSGLYGLLRRAGLPFAAAGLSGGMILILYTIMIGGSVSAVRALLMFLIRAGADISGRDYDLPTSLAVSAAVTGAWQPLYLLDAAYQLSYGAIMGIALLTPVFEDMVICRKSARTDPSGGTGGGGVKGRKEIKGRMKTWGSELLRKLLAGFCSSLAVSVFLMGPLLYFYFEVPSYSAVLNLFVIPAMPLVMGAGLLGSFLTLISGGLGGLVLTACKAVLMAYDALCTLAGCLPGSRFVTGRPGILWLSAYYIIVALLYLAYRYLKYRQKIKVRQGGNSENRRILRVPGVLLLCLGALMPAACRVGYQWAGKVQITVLDVGQGDGIFIRNQSGRAFFVDGGSSDVSSPGTYRIEPFLLSQGTDTLEYVFLSHGDADHINGIEELLANQKMGVKIKNLVLPPKKYLDEALVKTAQIAAKHGTRVVTVNPGDGIREEKGGQEFGLICLAPGESLAAEAGSNSASLVLELSYGEFSMLLTGDLEGEGEKKLAESGRLNKCTILKAAHHGSGSSGTEDFLDIIKPSAAIISAGRGNRYGHPHPETLERMKKAGCTVYSTQDYGAVTVRTDGKTAEISGFIQE